jgi:hypothetical protein
MSISLPWGTILSTEKRTSFWMCWTYTIRSDMAFLLILQKRAVQCWDGYSRGTRSGMPPVRRLFETADGYSTRKDNVQATRLPKVVGDERHDFTEPVTRETESINYLNENKTNHPRDTAPSLFDCIHKCWWPSMGSYVEDEPRFDVNSVNNPQIQRFGVTHGVPCPDTWKLTTAGGCCTS